MFEYKPLLIQTCRLPLLKFGLPAFPLMLISASCSDKTEDDSVLSPNIIFILADDMSYRDLSSYGQERYKTPNLDKLAMQGVRFTQAYSASPESAPSRASLMTGLHSGRSSVRNNSSARGQDNLLESDITVAKVLKEAGYNTGFSGKWGIGLPGTEGVPYKQGFDFAFGFYDQTRAHTFIPYYLWENDKKIEYPQNLGFNMDIRYDYKGNKAVNSYDEEGRLFIPELKDPYDYVYSENEILNAALRFLGENNPAKTGKPFFLYYATQLPHGPVIVDEMGEMAQPDSIMQLSREWAAMNIKLDKSVGRIVEHLKESGQYDNTIIFFASDNGYAMCGYTERGNGPLWPDDSWLQNKGPFNGGKFSVLEGGIRVPFFVSWPSKYPSTVISQPVWLCDFFPTAVSLAGLKPENYDTDGVSIIPLLRGEPDEFDSQRPLYFSKNREQAVRMGAWRAYRKTPDHITELYLVEEDTYTERNLAWLYPEVVQVLDSIMDHSFTPHPWYWTPDNTSDDYQRKVKRATESGNILPVYRPNDVKKFPWEK
jgi:arylsulfatase A-like enzyme